MSRIVNVANNKNMTFCFVCDQKVAGDRVNLASSLSSHSKVTLPEKISQLIGDDYVVAVTEQDCVCKRCASLLNHMDKLENELMLVKRALMTNISQKYKINFDGGIPQVPQQPIANGLKTDSASDYEDDTRKNSADVSASNMALVKKKIPPTCKVVPAPKPTKPAENVTKLKIYKCGFCSYQSKELGNVRLHMKIHIRANKPDSDGDKTTVSSSPLLAPKTNQVSYRRRVFRCQVCSASFDDRNKCLEHISRDHTAAGRKLVEQKQNQAEQQSQPTTTVDALSDSTSRVNVPNAEQPEVSAEASNVAAAAENNETMPLKEGLEADANNQEEMDTSEPPTIALYSCQDNGTSNFNNDVDFADQSNAHTDTKDEEMPTAVVETKSTTEESEPEKTEGTEFTEIPAQSDTQTTNDDETPKDENIGMDIEAMIAALHSEGPESATESMPNI